MLLNGLILSYKSGINTVWESAGTVFGEFASGSLLCHILQGETLDSIDRIFRNQINHCPFNDDALTPDTITEAEKYALTCLTYEDFFPAQRLAQGSFIRCVENYRSLDKSTEYRLLNEELERAAYYDFLSSEIGFDSVGNFLRLCLNNYIIDLKEAIRLFCNMSAIRSGSFSEDELNEYSELCTQLQSEDIVPDIDMRIMFDINTRSFKHKYTINSFLSLVVFEFSHIDESPYGILRCQNPECGKFFTPKRVSAKYCDYSCPQSPSHTCNDYYPQLLHRTKVKANELDRLVRNAQGRLYNDRRRHGDYSETIDGFLRSIQTDAPSMKQAVMSGEMSVMQFKNWLNSLKRDKGD